MNVQLNEQHFSDEAMDGFLSGEMSVEQSARMESHLSACENCAQRVTQLAAATWGWEEVGRSLVNDNFDGCHSIRPQDEGASMTSVLADVAGGPSEHEGALLRREISGWLDPTDDPAMLGRFAGYEIVGVVGHGGMGIVMKGFERALHRFVAIKVLAPRLAGNGAARKRFEREARAAAAVLHDNVIAIHRVDQWHGLPFLVMPYVAGESLRQRIDREGPLDLEATLRIGQQIAAGLAAAHAQGLVHRDIKPANILLDQGVERVTITDFGLARAADDAPITRTGFVTGTPMYMSPEQASAQPIDHRSDLFSLGSVMYSMATGVPPFQADANMSVLGKIRDEPAPDIRQKQETVPEWLVDMIDWCHAKSPDDRPQSAAELERHFGEWLAHQKQPQRVARPPRPAIPLSARRGVQPPSRWNSSWVALGGALLVLAGIFVTLETRKGTITIKSDVDDVSVVIQQGDKVYDKLTVGRQEKSIRLYAGQYEITFDGELDRMAIDDGVVDLSRGKEVVVRIREAANVDRGDSGSGTPAFGIPIDLGEALPEAGTLAALHAEFERVAARYHAAIGSAEDHKDLSRAQRDLDPREVMTPQYLKYEERHRGSKDGLRSLIKVAEMARSVGDPNSAVSKGRVEAIDRLIEHYLDHEGLEEIAGSLVGGPLVPRGEEFLELLVEKSPYRKTQAAALIAQIIHGKELLTAIAALPSHRKRMEAVLAVAPQSVRDDYRRRVDKLERTDAKQLKVDLNRKLRQLVENYSDVEVDFYGTARSASERLSHAINKVVVGSEAPELAATDIEGAPFRLSKLRGKIVVLVFTQSAGDNLREMYAPLRQLVAKYKPWPVRVIGIMSSGDPAELQKAASRGDFNWTVIPQPYNGPLPLDWGIEGYPTVFVVDAQGILHAPLHMPYFGDGGYDTKEVDEKLESLIYDKDQSPAASVMDARQLGQDAQRAEAPRRELGITLTRDVRITLKGGLAKQYVGMLHGNPEGAAISPDYAVEIAAKVTEQLSGNRYRVQHFSEQSIVDNPEHVVALEVIVGQEDFEFEKRSESPWRRPTAPDVVEQSRALCITLSELGDGAIRKANKNAVQARSPHFQLGDGTAALNLTLLEQAQILNGAESIWRQVLAQWGADEIEMAGSRIQLKIDVNDQPSTGLNSWSQGMSNPKISAVGSIDDMLADILPRQITYIFLARTVGRSLPRWIERGAGALAQSDEMQATYWSTMRDLHEAELLLPLPTLCSLKDDPSNREQKIRANIQSMAFCDFLIATHGREWLLTWAKTPDAELPDGVEPRFRDWLTTRFASLATKDAAPNGALSDEGLAHLDRLDTVGLASVQPTKPLTTWGDVKSHIASMVIQREQMTHGTVEFKSVVAKDRVHKERHFHVWFHGPNRRADCRDASSPEHFTHILTPTMTWYGDHQDSSKSQFHSHVPKERVSWDGVIDVRMIGLVNRCVEAMRSCYIYDDLLPAGYTNPRVALGERYDGQPITIVKLDRKSDGLVDSWAEFWLSPNHGNRPIYMAESWTEKSKPHETHVTTQQSKWRMIDGVWFPIAVKHRYQCEHLDIDLSAHYELVAAKFSEPPSRDVFDPQKATARQATVEKATVPPG